eukprot:TRINITY_DN3637_c0_g2_i1.p1 TRINITY_DN3637_c0_g2~~TRINITY_DN3637_c0_g2_i1.p1  ORF type:complete len:377 (+),score=54.34 TRINITY_DN3637_c0_g2_i1:1-1131(+)
MLRSLVGSEMCIRDRSKKDIVAKHLEKHLHNNVFGSQNWKTGEIISAFEEGFEKTDSEVIKLEHDASLMTGSTAVVGIIADDTLFVANVGDSEAILIREEDGKHSAVVLTEQHKANIPKEKESIEKLGGHVFFGRVFGALAVSRSFGDSRFKIPKTSNNFVSCVPYCNKISLNPKTDKYVVFACDGLWDVMNDRDVAKFVMNCHKNNKTVNDIAKELVDEALNLKTDDNVTVVVVSLKWTDVDNHSKSGTHEEQKEHHTPEKAVKHTSDDANTSHPPNNDDHSGHKSDEKTAVSHPSSDSHTEHQQSHEHPSNHHGGGVKSDHNNEHKEHPVNKDTHTDHKEHPVNKDTHTDHKEHPVNKDTHTDHKEHSETHTHN